MSIASMLPLPPVPNSRYITNKPAPNTRYVSRGKSEENILDSPRSRASPGFITRSRSQDLRKVLLTASLSSSCPDLLEDEQHRGAKIRKQSRTESFDLLPSRLGGATERSRALGIGLQRNSPRPSIEGSSRAGSPSLGKIYQDSSENSTPVSSRRAAANSSSKDSPYTEGQGSTQSAPKVALPVKQSDKDESQRQSCEVNGHVKLHRTSASVSDGNTCTSRCSSANTKSDKSDAIYVNVLKLTKENLTESGKTICEGNKKNTTQLKTESKKENKSFLKNLFGFKKRPFMCNRECNNTPDGAQEDIPDTMTRAQFERCCQWLEEVEKAKNNRCIEVTASPPTTWTE